MLAVHDLSVNYRGIEALSEVSLTLNPGEWIVLIRPNRPGKSTRVKALLIHVPAKGPFFLIGLALKRHPPQVAYGPHRPLLERD